MDVKSKEPLCKDAVYEPAHTCNRQPGGLPASGVKRVASQRKQVILQNLAGLRNLYGREDGQKCRFRSCLISWSGFNL